MDWPSSLEGYSRGTQYFYGTPSKTVKGQKCPSFFHRSPIHNNF